MKTTLGSMLSVLAAAFSMMLATVAMSSETNLAPSPLEKSQILPKKLNSLQSSASASQAGVGVTYAPILFTNGPETVLFDTMSSSLNGVLASWRDVRTSPVPDGMALGILIQTNYPFELTKIEMEVLLENLEGFSDTELEVGFFRNTNQFRYAMYVDPEYTLSDAQSTLSNSWTDLGNGHWLLSIDLSTYGWGTNRVVTIRMSPRSSGTMTKMSLITGSDIIPGITAYTSDNTATNMAQVALPKMRVWRRMIAPFRSIPYDTFMTDMDLIWVPGYQLGCSTNLLSPWTWTTDKFHNERTVADIRGGTKFFLLRPDPTDD